MIDIPDLPRLHTAIAEWLACVIYLSQLKKSLHGWKLFSVAALALVLLLATNLIGEIVPISLWMVFFVMGMLVMYFMLRICSDTSNIETGYYWARAFLVAEFAASLEWQVNFYLFFPDGYQSWKSLVCMTVVYLLLFSCMYLLEAKMKTNNLGLKISIKELTGSIMIALAAFSISNINFVFQDTVFTKTLGAGSLSIRTLVDLAGIILLFTHDEQRKEFYLRCELDAMDNLFNRQYEQYKQFVENSDTIRRVYHDLKHQIDFILNEPNAKEREKYLSEITRAVNLYKAGVATGNSVLDTLITSKNRLCIEKHIVMTCYANAQKLKYIDVMDICSMFGNSLDNAIEYEEKIQDVNKRLIKVSVYPQGNMLIIRIDNYCEEQIISGNELPVTTKTNKTFHGFGIKSIQRTVAKYGGHVSVSNKDNWFSVIIVIPLPKE